MSDQINQPEIVAEVRAAFDRYNTAIDTNDVAALNQCFWESPHTVRLGHGENLFGHAEIARYRGTKWTSGPARRLVRVAITTIGHDCAVTNAVFEKGDDLLLRQSQTWARFPEGWRIVAAHVSHMKK